MESRFGPYEVLGILGEGGQGTVHLGRAPGGAQVAIKALHSRFAAEGDVRRRFLREAEAARKVSPFCTARVLDVGDGYIVSEYVPGPSLGRLVREHGPRTGGGLPRLAVATLTALENIHRAGLVHLDFKPGNVIMGPEGPVVIDFGIARVLDQTATSSIMGTPAFMAPEQFAGGPIGPAADLFSWASTMVFAATGRNPFPGDTMPSVMHAILMTEPDLSGVPEDLRPLLHACLGKDPALRPTAAQALATMTALPQPMPPAAAAVPDADEPATVSAAHEEPSSGPDMVSLTGAVLTLLAVAPLLYYSVYFALATLGYGTGFPASLSPPFDVETPRAVMVSLVACALCLTLHHVSASASLIWLLHIPLTVLFALNGVASAGKEGFKNLTGFDLMAVVSLASVLTSMLLLATAMVLWRWNWVMGALGMLVGALMGIGGITGVFSDLGVAAPRAGAFASEALGRLALAVWVLAVAWLVLGQAVYRRLRASAAR
ncbi:serine/threonine-protein kinase [Nonomuraea typhae]|uniref:serine/threonine-protein kinase n=1 Tax=Nonomuraea typhae TaxID=2603600 RepID=UPI0012F82660|nr:serine/threonine-protein kinase [Nonomuraea typhae]